MQNIYLQLNNDLKEKFKNCKLLAMDFDGVITDDKVYISERGEESVRCDRSDGFAAELLRTYTDVEMVIVSKELNPVVQARAKKLLTPIIQSRRPDDKLKKLEGYLHRKKIEWNQVCYIGNDINDIACMKKCCIGVAVVDSHPQTLKAANYVTTKKGGQKAVREICDILLSAKGIDIVSLLLKEN